MNDTIMKKTMFLVPPIPLVEETKDKDEKPNATDVMEFLLKQRAGSTATAPTYKLKVFRFCKGTVLEWISFRKAIAELSYERRWMDTSMQKKNWRENWQIKMKGLKAYRLRKPTS
jgi:hypothetical protein